LGKTPVAPTGAPRVECEAEPVQQTNHRLKSIARGAVLPLLAAALLGLLIVLPGSARPQKGEMAPDFTAATLDGKTVVLSSFRGKSPVVLNFFADFCAPCHREFPHLKNLDEKYRGRGLRVIAVSMDGDRATAAAFARRHGARFPVVFDPSAGVADKYRVQAMPHTLVLDRSGRVHATITGLDLKALDRAVEQVMP
jgi:cytochrome c biogenesis protein CcmG, thiol:disulfide interchange protein DsbE